jgi:alanyl-tRNA synthetase
VAKTMLGINEACQRYHVSPATLRRAIKAGKLEGVRREKTGNGVWRIPNSSLKTLYKPRKGSTQEKNNKAENLPKINENQPEDITALRMQIEILQAKLEAAQDLARVQESRADELSQILKANLLVSAEKMTVINADSDHSQEVVHDYSQPLSKAAPPAKQSRFMTMLRRLFDHGQG